MKNFNQFFKEAAINQASTQARKLNLKSDGHGGWLDSRGEFVAKTEDGRLKFYNKRQAAGEKDPDQRPKASGTPSIKKPKGPVQQMAQRRADDDLAGAPLEKKGGGLTVAFGRFNPPTMGHEKLLSHAKKVAAGGDLKIYPSRTQDAKKNPLDPDMKVSYMRKMFPDFEEQIINDPEMRSIFDVLITASKEGYDTVNIVVGQDRLGEFESLAQKYNGDLYDFEEIKVLSAGPRDSEKEGAEGMSASKLRKAVIDDDLEGFKRGMPKGFDAADAVALYDAVRTGMGVKKKKVDELWQIAPKFDLRTLREQYLLGKIFNLGEFVESLNTGLVGKVIRKGTNYLICVTEQNNMFKSWIHDVKEATKPKISRFTDKSGVPSDQRLIGTDAYLRYAEKLTPGSSWGRHFINKYKAKKN